MSRSFTSIAGAIVLGGALLMPVGLYARQDSQQPAPDNTSVNKRDRNSSEPTADQGKDNRSDRERERQIRREIVKDKSLSTYGHNVKVISEHGKVTLKGPVHSEEEKRAIEEHARKYAGDGNVMDEITVKGDRK
jgi:osmotically-inducible protein OsmY